MCCWNFENATPNCLTIWCISANNC
ncbi:hypothetical protein GBAR_LOCUS17750 [Geodia barretti]|uniref:Uncharacterized protein n=1 Tax=Geodia barretti TaxID=519541 RepID=A0AA35SM58_GEOBA|nr:hypothetical protein GBAR_LOCUS17750 [Geodia barretti]